MLMPDGVLVVERVLKGDVAGALGLPPNASADQMLGRATELRDAAESALATATDDTRKDAVQAVHCLRLLERVLTDPALRRCWDAAFSHVARIPDGVDVSVLAGVHWDWRFVFPDISREAHGLFKAAMRCAADGQLAKAVELAQQALRLDPFHAALRGVALSWREALGRPITTPPQDMAAVH